MEDIDQRRAAEILERIHRDIYCTDPSHPGLMLRQDRLERQISLYLKILTWLASGGVLQLIATLALLYRLFQAIPSD